MKLSKLIALALLLYPAFITSSFASDTLTTAKLFSKSSEYSNVKYSPSGDYISAKTINDDKRILIILDAKTLKIVHAIQFGTNAQVGNYVWVNDDRIVFEKEYLKGWDDHPQYYGELMAVNADGSQAEYLFGYENNEQQTGSSIKKKTPYRGTAFILDPLQDDDRYMLVQALPWGAGSTSTADNIHIVFKVDVYRGTRRKITYAPISYSQFITDHDGEVRLVKGTNKDDIEQSFYYKSGDWINIDQLNLGLDDFTPVAFTKDPNIIYAAGRVNNQTLGIYTVNLTTGDKKSLIKDELVDPSQLWISEVSKELYAVEYEAEYPTYAFVNPDNQQAKILKDLIVALPGHQVHLVSQTRDGNKWIVFAFNDRNPGDYYTFDAETMKLGYLVSAREWLTPDDMAEVKPIKFTSRDGQTIHGYLTLPKGKDAKNLPLVVNPHGGPHGIRDWWQFDPQNQMLAKEGIAVLQVNFRGSGGYGDDFEFSGYKKWGAEIQYDIIDATNYVIEQGIVDKDRICIVGGSFGGYSALQSSILAPDLFKCAVGFAGVYDLALMFHKGDVSDRRMGLSYLKKALGQDAAILKAMSPSENIDKLKAKLLIVHGGEDERAPIEQYEALERKLKAYKYPFEKMILDDEGHGFYNDENRAEYYDKMLKFIKENLNVK